MPQPVKLSDALVEAARAESAKAERSIAGQIEHWAALGRMVEPGLKTSAVHALKSGQSSLEQALPPAEEGAAILAALTRAMDTSAAARVRSDFKNKVRYGTDPAYPGFVVRLEPDGRRTVGQFVKGKFEALQRAVADHV
jgi:hypothetical protein